MILFCNMSSDDFTAGSNAPLITWRTCKEEQKSEKSLPAKTTQTGSPCYSWMISSKNIFICLRKY